MRLVAGMLACLGVSAISLALADQPTTVPQAGAPAAATPTAAAPATAPAAVSAAPPSATPAAAVSTPAPSATSATQTPAPAAKPAVDPEEQSLLAQGYRPKMHHGQKVFCRTEIPLGSRLGGQQVCATVAELKAHHAAVREELERAQRTNTGTTNTGTMGN